MHISLWCIAIMAAAPDASPIKVAVPALQVLNADEKLGEAYAGHLAQQLSFRGLVTVVPTEIAAVLGLERQRQLLGCSDDSCKAGVVLSLGVDGLLLGRVTRYDKSFQLDVRIISPSSGQPLAAASASTETQDGLVGVFPVVADTLAKELAQKLGRTLSPRGGAEVVLGASRIKRMSWVPLIGAVAAGATSAVFLVLARNAYNDLKTQRSFENAYTPEQTNQIASSGRLNQNLGWTLTGVSAACLAAAALMFWLGGNDTVQSGLALIPGGAMWGISGVFP